MVRPDHKSQGSHISWLEPAFTFHCALRFCNPVTRAHVRLLGPCFKTGRMGYGQNTKARYHSNCADSTKPKQPRPVAGNSAAQTKCQRYRARGGYLFFYSRNHRITSWDEAPNPERSGHHSQRDPRPPPPLARIPEKCTQSTLSKQLPCHMTEQNSRSQSTAGLNPRN